MKKLALAPAVALAITGIAAAPVFAAPSAKRHSQEASVPESATSPTPQDGQVEEAAAEFSISPTTISLADYGDPDKGVTYTGTGLEPGSTYTIVDTPSSGQAVESYEETVEVDETGGFAVTIYGSDNDVFLGTYHGEILDAEGTVVAETDYEVTAGGEEPPAEEPPVEEPPTEDPAIAAEASTLTVSEFKANGLDFSGENFTPGEEVTVHAGEADSDVLFFEKTFTADEAGEISGTLTVDGEITAGKYSFVARSGADQTATDPVYFTLTEDKSEEPTEEPPAAEASLAVSPETISPADFVKADKGVTLAVENCEPGSDVNFVVNPKGATNVTAYENTVQADDEGTASVNVYGTSASDPSAYVGDYEVTVSCGDDEMTGEFSVSDDANAGGSDGNDDGAGEDDNGAGGDDNGAGGDDNGAGGSELPRTGAELTGLAAGVALLLVGGAAVTMTVRRKKVAQSPAEF
ncbi:hypothetical protein [Brevibacterium sp.]|uniref:hypothetical protein n=1 Tax=Brevibacterium sp. TaxID=1701 RepID=UPI0028117939|nr:hypothetical protein [Brevibacterium sp.]